MKTTAYLKLSGSFSAIAAALITSPALAQSTSWTGGSAYYQNGSGAAVYGDNSWHNALNWSSGAPSAATDVSIGLSTQQQYITWTSCWNGSFYYDCGHTPHIANRPDLYDIVRIDAAAAARNLYIGFSGGRGLAAGAGAGHLVNNSTLDVGQNMVVGSTGPGTYENLGATNVGGSLVVGDGGQGVLANSGQMTVTGPTILGQHAGSNGTFTNTGTFETGSLTVGAGGTGRFINTGGGTTKVNGLTTVGQHAGSFGRATNSNGATFETNGLIVGAGGVGEFASDGTVTITGDTVIGQHAGSMGTVRNGTMTYTPGASFTTTGNLVVGGAGQGLFIANESVSVREDTVIGQGAGGSGEFRLGSAVLGAAVKLTTGGGMTIGENGDGLLTISNLSEAETSGRVVLASGAGSQGTVRNLDGIMTNNDAMIVGDQGFARLETTGASATTTTKGDVTVAADENGTGFVSVRQGTMNNEGRFDLGYEGRGYLVVDGGGKINNGVGVMATERNSEAHAVITGAGSLWDNRESLTLGRELGSEAVLVVNDDGMVRIAGGNGTLTIAEKEGSSGILNIGAMSPAGDDYGVPSDVTSYLGGISLDPVNSDARAAGILDAAFVQFGAGDGTVNFKHTETEADDYRFKAGFVGAGQVDHYEGFTVLDGDSSGFTGDAHVLGGVMVVNNVLAGNVTVDQGGELRIGHEGGSQPGDGTKGDVVNDIVNNGLVSFNRADTYTYDSVISGTGDVEQMGSGTTILTGENTYTGATTIKKGRLQLGDGGTAGSIDHTSGIAIEQDGTLAFNRSDLKVIDRVISGTGTIEQIGSGITRLTADSSGFAGNTQVNAGTLSVNGILGGTVDVNDGGTLEGLGTVGDTVVHTGGTIAPGNSIGTLTVDGDLIQEPGSFYQAEVMSTGETDLLHVTGTATVSNNAILNITKLDPARYELEHRYTVLTADGGLTGDYQLTGDTGVSTFYRLEDHYDSNNAYVDVWQHRLFPEAAWTPNQTAAATAAQELKSQRDPVTNYPTNPLFRAIAYLPDDQSARYAFDQISGELYASMHSAMLNDSRFVRDATGNRLRAAMDGVGRKVPTYHPGIDVKDPTPYLVWADAEQEGLVLWGEGFGTQAEVDGDGNAAYLHASGGGMFVGADMPVADIFRVGIVAGYGRTKYDVKDRHSAGESSNYTVGLYGGAKWNGFGLQLGAGYTWHDVETTRNVVFPGFAESLSAEFDASTLQFYGDLGYTFELGGLRLEPFVGLAYVDIVEGDYREQGGVAALSGSDRSLDMLYGTLGLRGDTTFHLDGLDITAHGLLGWRRGFDDVSATATHQFSGSSPFTVSSVISDEDLALVEAGLDAAISEKLSLGVVYSGQFGDAVEAQAIHGTLNWHF